MRVRVKDWQDIIPDGALFSADKIALCGQVIEVEECDLVKGTGSSCYIGEGGVWHKDWVDVFVEVELSWKDFLKTSADLGLSSNLSCPPVGTTLIEMGGSRWRHIGEGRWEPTAVGPGIPIMPSASDVPEPGLTLEKLDEAIKLIEEDKLRGDDAFKVPGYWPVYIGHDFGYNEVEEYVPQCYEYDDPPWIDWRRVLEISSSVPKINNEGGEMQVFEAIVIDRIMVDGKGTISIVKEFSKEVADSKEQMRHRIIAQMGDGWQDTYIVLVRTFMDC